MNKEQYTVGIEYTCEGDDRNFRLPIKRAKGTPIFSGYNAWGDAKMLSDQLNYETRGGAFKNIYVPMKI